MKRGRLWHLEEGNPFGEKRTSDAEIRSEEGEQTVVSRVSGVRARQRSGRPDGW